MSQMFKLLFTIILFSSFSLKAQVLSLKEGDIIGESEVIEDSSTAYIEAATKSRFGHVGLVLEINNELLIYEEYPPGAQIVSINDFLKRAPGLFSVIRRDSSFTTEELLSIHKASDDLVKQNYPYNYSQIRNNTSMNCSEFVNFVFSKANINVGKIETIGAMNLKAFGGIPWGLWKLSSPGLSRSAEVITPKSVMQTNGWSKVKGMGTLNPGDNLSDRDLYLQWKDENALSGIAHEWYMFKWELSALSHSSKTSK